MFTDECRPPMGPSVALMWVVLGCEPYIDPVTARLHELLPLLNQSRDVLRVAPLSPGQPERPSDSTGGDAILTPALVRRSQLAGIDRMITAVNQTIAARRTAGRRVTPGSRPAAPTPASVVPYAQIIEGASRLRTILRDEVRENPNARGRQALLNNVEAVLRDLGTIVPRLASSPAEARRSYQRFVDCTRERNETEARLIAEDRQRHEEENRRNEAEWRRYIECRRQQRGRAAAERRMPVTNTVNESEEADPILELMPEDLRRRYIEMLRGNVDSSQIPASDVAPPSAPAE